MRAISAIGVLKKLFRAPFALIDIAAPRCFKVFFGARGHTGVVLGGIAVNRRIRSRMVWCSRRRMVNPASGNGTYRACQSILLPILINLPRSIISVQCFTLAGSAKRPGEGIRVSWHLALASSHLIGGRRQPIPQYARQPHVASPDQR